MVLGVLSPVEEKKSNEKSRQTVDERAPLLPPVYCDSDNVECDEFNRASFSGAVFNLSTTVVGAGIMGLPAAMKLLGIGPGIAIIIFMAFLTEFSIKIMLKFSKPANSVTYSGLMRDSFGRTGEIALQICIIINNVGTLVVFMIIIGDVLSGTSSSGMHHSGVLEGLFDSLRYTSALSVALAVVFVIITTGIVTMKFLNGSTEMPRFLPNVTDVASFLKLFTAVPVLVTAYICHYNVHPITKELEDNSEMQSIVRISLILCMVVYTTTSFFCFLLFGESTLDDVLANFDVDLGIPYSSFLTSILRICYAIHLMLVAPIAFFGLRLNLDELLFPSARPLVLDNKRFTLINMALIAFIFIGANFIPSIWDAFQFTGATSGVCMGFIFPGAVALRDQHGIATKKDKILGIFMVVLAVFSSTVAIYSDANSMFKKNNGSLRA
ncbi:sodium-coupled neutral amino acid transporter 1 isoform X2 [Amborella trichopoda]|uniref:sodium-coupled neutral amino acid transporter 1 isoform X2 n=1 Tax=Amborella trichopoda TaxID=13333 RepID=UPI0009C15D7A|nr:sodium-coupled neutral amino acid transporter 1 isoform X2 [Amborella trichopoda]|eukprot:XP_020522697.1 sodium-coupled neutral amino acid transporter 1 isoform X2 [Amborella trichopoda]